MLGKYSKEGKTSQGAETQRGYWLEAIRIDEQHQESPLQVGGAEIKSGTLAKVRGGFPASSTSQLPAKLKSSLEEGIPSGDHHDTQRLRLTKCELTIKNYQMHKDTSRHKFRFLRITHAISK